ncbi:MAG: hypothetical protein H6738_15640 [Alphaproteobacteria bacterium]|nr:hypothetical protein [Alphaproteobacteria bacterium]MCB9698211.1 hypothetical protein [Alphaproteobacteria bacterium]
MTQHRTPSAEELEFLKGFYRALGDRPLEPDDSWYVALYQDEELAASDPVEQLATAIEWSALESTHLFSGFRGTGKSTELRRLRARLRRTGRHVVVLCDMVDTLNLGSPVDAVDFLIGVAGAFGDALDADPDLLGHDPGRESYWARAVGLFRTLDVEVGGNLGVASATLKTNLRKDPTFRERLREWMDGRLGALVDDVHDYLKSCVAALRRKHGDDVEVVLLLDSIEQIRGTSFGHAESVYSSVEALFSNHAESLRFEDIHVVYTVPPWLKIRSPGIAGEYGGMQLLPCVRVRDRATGEPFRPGLDALERVIGRRGDWKRVLGTRARLDRLLLASGGYLRDLLRLLQAVLREARNRELPVGDDVVELALHEVRNSYLPLARHDAAWLAEIHASGNPELDVHRADGDEANLYDLSRFFDTHLVLCYRTLEEWYDVHPLLLDEVLRQAGERRS